MARTSFNEWLNGDAVAVGRAIMEALLGIGMLFTPGWWPPPGGVVKVARCPTGREPLAAKAPDVG
jgi:hypothetical protein